MPLADLLTLAGSLSAPAFFIIFALAALGAPPLAFLCLASAELYSSAHLEPFARRILRMALTCAVPALLAVLGSGLLALARWPWLLDWLRAAPLGPVLLTVAVLAYLLSLMLARRTRPDSRRGRSASPIGQAFILTLLAAAILWLAAAMIHGLQEQARAVLAAPSEAGVSVAPLLPPDATAMDQLMWTSLAAIGCLAVATAGAASLEYLLLLRDREPFGHEAQAQMLRIGARTVLRAGLLAAAFLPVLLNRLPALSGLPGAELSAQALIIAALAGCLAACALAALLSRSKRPWTHPLMIHAILFCLWFTLTALATLALVCFYAA